MASDFDKLTLAMKVANSESDHKLIYKFSLERMNPEATPPLSAVRYGVDRVLFPTMVWECIPHILDALALAEEIREKFIENAKEALIWDNFHRGKQSKDMVDGVHLTQEDREFLKKVTKDSRIQTRREVYRVLVDNICFAYILHVRRSDAFLIPAYFHKYFPKEEELSGIAERGTPLWLSKMSEKEIAAHQTIRKAAASFIQNANEWEEEEFGSILNSKDRDNPEYQNAFESKFQPGIPWDVLTNNLRSHLLKIESDCDRMQKIF